jgi:hypothetical protein
MYTLIATLNSEELGTFKVNYIPRLDETIIIKNIFYTVKDVTYTLDEARSIILTLKIRG